ncbi:SIS domain-containing protein [Desulfovibrio sp. JC022]|uniref:D-sedoheptulose-7-phosphate isomerase n=1 Tax=Desulfovibrio sp. JC022 TaxID=2593642 RepID=UPI0013D61F0B|nr:SIS domain-containing protein [Desulfovibrio sp. JC022]NDV23220.1 SIS domain-containing protein [Desulfovibrio sp. JC022]
MIEIQKLIKRFPVLSSISTSIEEATNILVECAKKGNTIFTCGNGGSAADAEHIAGELMKSFVRERPLPKNELKKLKSLGPEGATLASNLQKGIRAIPLTGMPSLSTAYLNDCEPYCIFAQQVYNLANEGDCLLAISTSGNSPNIVYAAIAAKAKGVKTILLSGRNGGKLADICDENIIVPEQETYIIQELHLPIYHAICLEIERQLFN